MKPTAPAMSNRLRPDPIGQRAERRNEDQATTLATVIETNASILVNSRVLVK